MMPMNGSSILRRGSAGFRRAISGRVPVVTGGMGHAHHGWTGWGVKKANFSKTGLNDEMCMYYSEWNHLVFSLSVIRDEAQFISFSNTDDFCHNSG